METQFRSSEYQSEVNKSRRTPLLLSEVRCVNSVPVGSREPTFEKRLNGKRFPEHKKVSDTVWWRMKAGAVARSEAKLCRPPASEGSDESAPVANAHRQRCFGPLGLECGESSVVGTGG